MGNRYENKGMWLSLFSSIGLALQALGVFEELGVTNDAVQNLISAILTFLVAVGVLSNPTTESKWYSDDKPPNAQE